MSVLSDVRKFFQHNKKMGLGIKTITVEVTPEWARRVFKIKKDAPLAIGGITLNCIGSKLWRQRHWSGHS